MTFRRFPNCATIIYPGFYPEGWKNQKGAGKSPSLLCQSPSCLPGFIWIHQFCCFIHPVIVLSFTHSSCRHSSCHLRQYVSQSLSLIKGPFILCLSLFVHRCGFPLQYIRVNYFLFSYLTVYTFIFCQVISCSSKR